MVITEASEVPSLPGDTQLLRGSTGGGRIQHSEPRGGAELDDPNRPDRGPTLSIEGQVLPPELVNRCNNFDLSGLAMGASCGEPLSSPCFDFGRCGGASPTIYVYDTKVICMFDDYVVVGIALNAFKIHTRRNPAEVQVFTEPRDFFLHGTYVLYVHMCV